MGIKKRMMKIKYWRYQRTSKILNRVLPTTNRRRKRKRVVFILRLKLDWGNM
jgi:hypothetical protein